MSFPSISDLFWILVDLAKAVTKYYFFLGSWNDVSNQYNRLVNWFNNLSSYIYWRANSLVQPVRDWAQGWFSYLDSWRQWAVDNINSAFWWINNVLKVIQNWYNSVNSRVTWLVQTAYSNIVWLVSTAWNYLTWYVQTVYNNIAWLVGAAWNTLVWLVQTGYSYLAWLVSSAYNYLVWFVSTGYNYLAWLVNTAYNYLVWFVQTGYAWLAWFISGPVAIVESWLGAAWQFVKSLFGLNPTGLLAFIRDAMVYWYNIWSHYGQVLSAFLADPTGWILTTLTGKFLDWLERELADNW
jgi:hypothetical protein